MIRTYSLKLDDIRHPLLVKEKEYDYGGKTLNSPKLAVKMLNDIFDMRNLAEEYIYMISVDNRMRPLGIFELAHGSVNQAFLGTREMCIRALLTGASGVILAHNHPSGSLYPSQPDSDVFRKSYEALRLLSIDLQDFIIIANDTEDKGYCSFQEMGYYDEIR